MRLQEKRIETTTNQRKKTVELVVGDKDYLNCKEERGQFDQDKAPNMLMEGGHYLLMRYLVQQQFVGEIDLTSISVEGKYFYYSIFKLNSILLKICSE